MGYMVHHTIVVTAYKGDIEKAHEKAVEIFGNQVSNLVASKINGYQSFFVAPDGSKLGWSDSDEGDENRNTFIEWLKSQDDFYIDWVEVQYGDDEGYTKIIRDSDHP